MNTTTLCPTCNTRFKVSPAQLDAHQGLVRCGRCQAVFNATEYLQDDQPSPQLDLPIAPEATQPTLVKTAAEPAPATQEEPDFRPAELHLAEQQDTERQNGHARSPLPCPLDETTSHSTKLPKTAAKSLVIPQTGEGDKDSLREFHVDAEPQDKIEPAEFITLAQKIAFADNPDATPFESSKKKKKRTWPWIVGSLLLLIILLAQAAYFFRVELAATQPNLKPALISFCRLLQCAVPLPQEADLIGIESSNLEADPTQASVISLDVLLRNLASYTQAYPNLELTLTDAQDKPLARRTFRPAEYLKPDEDEKQGLTANRELSVKLNLDTTDIKPSGYRLLLFYPQ